MIDVDFFKLYSFNRDSAQVVNRFTRNTLLKLGIGGFSFYEGPKRWEVIDKNYETLIRYY